MKSQRFDTLELRKSNVKGEVKKIISEMFAFGKNIIFSGNQEDDEPENVEFEIDINDYKLDYEDELSMEYTDGVSKKKKYNVSLIFNFKYKEGSVENPIYKIRFKINLS